jgi:two-component system CheB/CheR fusion protein
MGFVLVQHLDPTHESGLTEILSRATTMRVQEVTDDLRVEPNQVYVIPPNTCMEISQGTLRLTPRKVSRGAQRSIDSFFESLARERAGSSIGVVLSGTASDGTLGLEAIKAEGGITFAQDDSAKFDSMPRNAVAAGCVDFVLPPSGIAAELARIAKHPLVSAAAEEILRGERDTKQVPDRLESSAPIPALSGAKSKRPRTETQDDQLQAPSTNEAGFAKILLLLRNQCGVDFSPYKPSTIHRRISRRMVLNRQSTLDEYASFAKGNTKELEALYADVLISVTSFFRNSEAFDVLKQKVLRPLLAERKRDGLVRVWTLGCSTGQEAYSIAMAFAEAAEKVSGAPKLQIFATDLNEASLEKARHGLYAKTLVQDISPERLRRFFIEEEGGYRVSKALREQVVFARQNVMSDPPFSRIDLVSCRNLLIYFETDLQKRIMPAFHYALMPGGFLFLGASESIGPFIELFTPVDKKQRIFAKNPAPTPAFRLSLSPNRGAPASVGQRAKVRGKSQGVPEGMRAEFDAQREADRLSCRLFAPPGVLVNAELQVLQFRGVTWAYLQPPVGRANFNVLKMAHDGLMLPLRAAINKAKREKKTVRRENVQVHHDDRIRLVHLQVIPLKNVKEHCYLILFEDAKKASGSGEAVLAARDSKRILPNLGSKKTATRVAELERELAETRDYLQSIQEQHDASAEELQAASEEGQSANEELQSINEELETSKEELESTNEELTTVNEEMANRNSELNGLNNDLNNLHVSINTAILVLGRDLTIRRFTPQAEKLFNLLPGDIGRPISGIRHNLECRDLEAFVREVIDTVSFRDREVQDKGGHWYSLRARPYVTLDKRVDGAVLVLVDITALKTSEQTIREGRDYADAILQEVPPLLILNKDLRVERANESFYKHFRVTPAETEERLIYDLGNGQWQIPRLRALLEDILPRHSFFNDFEIVHEFVGLGRRTMLLHARQLDSVQRIVLRVEDVTERLESRAAVMRSEIRYRRLFEAAQDGVLIIDPSSRKITDANPFIADLLGYTHDELLGKELWQIGLIENEEASNAAFAELKTKGFIRYEDLPLETKGGQKREVEFVSNLYEEGGTNTIQCNIRDITERHRADLALEKSIEDLKITQAALENSSRAKDDFLAALSHELRTPLAPALLTAAVLRDDERLPPEVRSQLAMIERNIALEARLIDDMLDLTAVTRGKLQLHAELCDTHSLIGLAIEIVREDARDKGVEIERVFTAKHSGLVADPARFQQVIWNLLRNAVKFTPPGGKISIHTREEKAPSGERWLRIEVKDTGVGIEPALLERIFLPFDQGSLTGGHRFGGIGLGLAIARAVVHLHGGRISARSEGENLGSSFVVELPGAVTTGSGVEDTGTPFVAGLLAGPRTPSAVAARPLRLLLVEDHISSLQTLTLFLQRDGHHVASAATVTAARAAAEKEEFDLVISDLGLPDGSGTELMEILRDSYGLRGIALSGYGMEDDLVRSRAAGFIKHLVKPVSLFALRSALAEVVQT